jgi:hypothetical protein
MQTWNKYLNSNKELLDIWADEYYIQKQKLAIDQEVLSDKKLYDNIMEQKANGFCNIICNVLDELKSKEIYFMFMGFRLKKTVFKKYYDQIIIENYG